MPVSSGNINLHESILSDQYLSSYEQRVKASEDDDPSTRKITKADAGERTLRQAATSAYHSTKQDMATSTHSDFTEILFVILLRSPTR